MKSEICKDKTYTVKEGVTLQMISDLRPELSEQEDVREEEEDPLVEEDEDHQANHQRDDRADRREEMTIETGTISKVTMKVVT